MADTREELEVAGFEPAIRFVAVGLDPSPAAERVAARDRCDVADTGRAHDLVPAARQCEVTAGLGTQARRRVRAQREDVLRREVVVGVLELELSWNSWPKVMLGNAAEWKQRLGVREGPAPTIEADHALEIGDRFALDRLPVEG
jgi:hypothetical protein